MDNHLILTVIILATAIILFVSNRLPADLIALLVVVALGLTGVLTTQEAFSGFSRTAVITIIAIFVLTEALQRTIGPLTYGSATCVRRVLLPSRSPMLHCLQLPEASKSHRRPQFAGEAFRGPT